MFGSDTQIDLHFESAKVEGSKRCSKATQGVGDELFVDPRRLYACGVCHLQIVLHEWRRRAVHSALLVPARFIDTLAGGERRNSRDGHYGEDSDTTIDQSPLPAAYLRQRRVEQSKHCRILFIIS